MSYKVLYFEENSSLDYVPKEKKTSPRCFKQEEYAGYQIKKIVEDIESFRETLKSASNERNKQKKFMSAPICLNIYEKDVNQFWASYFIGLTWIVPNKIAAVVVPRLENLNLDEMYRCALSISGEDEKDYFSKCYGIDFNQSPIAQENLRIPITPLLILHYTHLLKCLEKNGLKKGYVSQTANLKSKIRGKILVSKHISKNIALKREDRVYCSYQEYTEDIPENRLLKKALLFAEKIVKQDESLLKNAGNDISKLSLRFEHISSDISVSQVQKVSQNKIFAHYAEACRVAKMILRLYDYSLSNITSKTYESVYPYWIDLSRLFELYTLYQLRKNSTKKTNILFQVPGRGRTKADFVQTVRGNVGDRIDYSDGIIMDAKFKPKYASKSVLLDDVREISGYTRDVKILTKMGIDCSDPSKIPLVSSLVIYPKGDVQDDDYDEDEKKIEREKLTLMKNRRLANGRAFIKTQFQNAGEIFDIDSASEVAGYVKMYKVGLKLPLL